MARPVGGRLLAMIPIVIAALLGVAFYWGLWNKDDRLPSTLIGRPAPVFALPPIEGRNDGLSSEDLRGEVSIVDVWASWCVPCRVEMPLLVDLAETGTVPIYGINHRDPPEAALAFLRELGDPYNRIGADQHAAELVDPDLPRTPPPGQLLEELPLDVGARVALGFGTPNSTG